MDNEKIEAAFQDASDRWDEEHPTHNPKEFANNRAARYFFFAGSAFGLASAKEIYSESYERTANLIESHTEESNP